MFKEIPKLDLLSISLNSILGLKDKLSSRLYCNKCASTFASIMFNMYKPTVTKIDNSLFLFKVL